MTQFERIGNLVEPAALAMVTMAVVRDSETGIYTDEQNISHEEPPDCIYIGNVRFDFEEEETQDETIYFWHYMKGEKK